MVDVGALLGSESEALGHHYLVPEAMEPYLEPQPRFSETDDAGRCSWCRQPTRILALITRQMHEHEPRLTSDRVRACPPCAHACHDGGRRWERHLEALRRRARIRVVQPPHGLLGVPDDVPAVLTMPSYEGKVTL